MRGRARVLAMTSGVMLPGPTFVLDSAPTARRRCPELGCGGQHGHAGALVPEAVPPVPLVVELGEPAPLPAPPPLPREERTTDAPPAREPCVVCGAREHLEIDCPRFVPPRRYGTSRICPRGGCAHDGGAACSCECHAGDLATLARDYLAAEDAERAAIGDALEHDRDLTGPALDSLPTTTERARGRLLDALGVA